MFSELTILPDRLTEIFSHMPIGTASGMAASAQRVHDFLLTRPSNWAVSILQDLNPLPSQLLGAAIRT
jgi:hypothetical protein